MPGYYVEKYLRPIAEEYRRLSQPPNLPALTYAAELRGAWIDDAMREIDQLRAIARELDRLSLVIESAVRNLEGAGTPNHQLVVELIHANRAGRPPASLLQEKTMPPDSDNQTDVTDRHHHRFLFGLGQRVQLAESQEQGRVVAQARYEDGAPDSYLVLYQASDGRQVKDWWNVTELVEPSAIA